MVWFFIVCFGLSEPPGCFYGWGFFLVYINMSTNLQPIPLGLIAIKPYVDFIVTSGADMEPGDTTYQNDAFGVQPSVFIDGLLLTYAVCSDRRYVSYDGLTKTLTLNNGGVNDGENVQIFL